MGRVEKVIVLSPFKNNDSVLGKTSEEQAS